MTKAPTNIGAVCTELRPEGCCALHAVDRKAAPHDPGLDFLGFGERSAAHLRLVFAEILSLDVPDDGVAFDLATLEVGPIREDQEYGGMRVELIARVTNARVRIQVDVAQLGMANSRMKDFYDVAVLARLFDFDGALLASAIHATDGSAVRSVRC